MESLDRSALELLNIELITNVDEDLEDDLESKVEQKEMSQRGCKIWRLKNYDDG